MLTFLNGARAALIAFVCLFAASCSHTAVSTYNGNLSAKGQLSESARKAKIKASRKRAAAKQAKIKAEFKAKREARRKARKAKRTAKTDDKKIAKTTSRKKNKKKVAAKKSRRKKTAKASRKTSRKAVRKAKKSTRKSVRTAKAKTVISKGKKKTVKSSHAYAGAAGRRMAALVRNGRPWNCVPARLKRVINDVRARFGKVIITSTNRSKRHNRLVGGKKRSYHLGCRAIDFYVKGRTKGLVSYLARHPGVGGYKRYARTGHYHIDTGPKRTW